MRILIRLFFKPQANVVTEIYLLPIAQKFDRNLGCSNVFPDILGRISYLFFIYTCMGELMKSVGGVMAASHCYSCQFWVVLQLRQGYLRSVVVEICLAISQIYMFS
jgi:hypothetical protein